MSRDWIDKSLKKATLLPDDKFLLDDDDIIYEINKRKARLEKQKRKYTAYSDENEGVLYVIWRTWLTYYIEKNQSTVKIRKKNQSSQH